MPFVASPQLKDTLLVCALCLFVFGAACVWIALTQKVPSPQHRVVAQGTIERAGWRGGRHGAFVIKLVNDSRRFSLSLTQVWKKLGAPADVAWLGKNARLVAAEKAHWLTGRTFVYSLELDDRIVYDVDDLRKHYDSERLYFLGMAIASLALGGLLLWWRKRRLAAV